MGWGHVANMNIELNIVLEFLNEKCIEAEFDEDTSNLGFIPRKKEIAIKAFEGYKELHLYT